MQYLSLPLTALCVLASLTLGAQYDYMLFRPGMQYMFSDPELESNGAPELMGMRLTADSCAEAYPAIWFTFADDDLFSCHQLSSSFAGYRVCQHPDSTVLWMGRADSALVIRTGAPVGERWLCGHLDGDYSPGPVYAEVTDLREETFLGITDSVKYIRLFQLSASGIPRYLPGQQSNAPPLRVSKQHGMVGGFDFRILDLWRQELVLASLSDPTTVIQNPLRADIFDMQVGDEFHWEDYNTISITPKIQALRVKQRALHLLDIQDFIVGQTGEMRLRYGGRTLQYQRSMSLPLVYSDTAFYADTFTVVLTAEEVAFLDYQPGQARVPNNPWGLVRTVHLEPDGICGQVGKYLDRGWQPSVSDAPGCLGNFHHGPMIPYYYQGLGGPYFDHQDFSGWRIRRQLIYYRRAGEPACGTPFDFTAISPATAAPAAAPQPNVFPNPCTDELWWQGSPPDGPLRLFNTWGQLVRSWPSAPAQGQPLSLQGLPPGVYVLWAQSKSEAPPTSVRVVKQQ